MELKYFTKGNTKNVNQDRYKYEYIDDILFVVVADGMGGLMFGEIAAQTATDTILEYLKANYCEGEEKQLLYKSLEEADNRIREIGLQYKCKMGTAIVAAIILKNTIFYTWQGNVRVYLKGKSLIQLTEDHIADIGYGKTGLTRCLKGAGLRDDIPFNDCPISKNEEIIICTDGAYSLFSDNKPELSIEYFENLTDELEDDCTIISIST